MLTNGGVMNKTLLCLFCLLTGCGWFDRVTTSITGNASKICVDGVTYLQFTSGSTVQVDVSGKPVPCR